MKASDFPLRLDGCVRFRDVSGHRFGRLVVLSRELRWVKPKHTQSRNQFRHWWKCQCDCGNIYYTEFAWLLREHEVSCGCVGTTTNLCPVIKAIVVDHRINTTKTIMQIAKTFGFTKGKIIGILNRAEMCIPKEPDVEQKQRSPIPLPKPNGCRYAFGHPGDADFHWCDEKVTRGSYCGEHHDRVYVASDNPRIKKLIPAAA